VPYVTTLMTKGESHKLRHRFRRHSGEPPWSVSHHGRWKCCDRIWCHGCVPPRGTHPCLPVIALWPSTDEPSAHPWHQVSMNSCIIGTHFQV